MLLRGFFIGDKVGVSIIDSIPHCHSENVLKRVQNQEIWLRFFTEEKVGVSIITVILKMLSKVAKIKKYGFVLIEEKLQHLLSIVFHTILLMFFNREQIQEMWLRFHTGHLNINVWYKIVDRYSTFVLFIESVLPFFKAFSV